MINRMSAHEHEIVLDVFRDLWNSNYKHLTGFELYLK